MIPKRAPSRLWRSALSQWPLLIALAFLGWITLSLGRQIYATNFGSLCYSLDDAFIHMALAKNLVLHGVFGVTRYEFASCTSSPLWTLLIAGTYCVTGVQDWVPAFWNIFFAAAALGGGAWVLHEAGVGRIWAACGLLALLFLTPLPVLMSTGLEHTAHIAALLCLAAAWIRMLSSFSRWRLISCCMLAALAAGFRYESLFLIAPLCAALLFRRPISAILIGLSPWIVPVAYGLVSMAHGSYFLPNSLMMKGSFSGFARMPFDPVTLLELKKLQDSPHLSASAVLLALAFLAAALQRRVWSALPASALVALWLHLKFAALGWFYRYEAYVVAAALIFSVAALVPLANRLRSLSAIAAVGVAVLVLLTPMYMRARESLEKITVATRNIYDQQVQVARFIEAMIPPGTAIALNDLGAVSYFTDMRILDVWGLGSVEITKAHRAGKPMSRVAAKLIKKYDVKYAFLYRDLFKVSEKLVCIGNLTIDRNVVAYSPTVHFFGVTPEDGAELEKKWLAYRDKLPDRVILALDNVPNEPIVVRFEDLPTNLTPGKPWDAKGAVKVIGSGTIRVIFSEGKKLDKVTLLVDSSDSYRFRFLYQGSEVAVRETGASAQSGLAEREVAGNGEIFDEVVISVKAGDGRFSLGGIRLETKNE